MENVGIKIWSTPLKEKKTEIIFHISSYLLSVISFLFSLMSAFKLPCNNLYFFSLLTIVCILNIMIFSFQKNKKIMSIGIYLLLLVVFCFIFRGQVINSFSQLFAFMIETIKENNNIIFEFKTYINYDVNLITLSICVLSSLLSIIFGYCILYRPNIFIWLIINLPIMVVMLFFNVMPNLVLFCSIIISGVMNWSIFSASRLIKNTFSDNRKKINIGSASFLTSILVGLVILSSMLLISDESYQMFLNSIPERDGIASNIKNVFSITYEETTPPQGGICGGEFSKSDNFIFSGDTALIVTLDKYYGNIYLKGYTGEKYSKSGWTYNQIENDLSNEILNCDYDMLSPLFNEKKQSIEIVKGEAAVQDFEYYPYFLINKNENKYEYYDVSNYDNNLFLLNENKIYDTLKENCSLSNGKITVDLIQEVIKDENIYRKNIYEKYTDLPDGLEKLKEEFIPYKDKFKIRENIIKFVVGELISRTNYSLSPGETPEDVDFAEYFLYENQKGYCTHFATCATLIFRILDVPARYCEGYVITKTDFSRATLNEEGKYVINVRDTGSHAWCEVYLDGFGWLPVEVTPGLTTISTGDTASADGEEIDYETDKEEKINEIPMEIPRLEDQNIDVQDEEGSKSDGQNNNKTLNVYHIVILSLFLLLILILLTRKILVRNKLKKIDGNIIEWFYLFNKIYGERDYISLTEYANIIKEEGKIEKNDLDVIIKLLEKEAYSNCNIKKEEYEDVEKIFKKIIMTMYDQKSMLDKLVWLYVKMLPIFK